MHISILFILKGSLNLIICIYDMSSAQVSGAGSQIEAIF